MPPEPKKPIEELLEASARARRAEFGVDPQMPNPTRTRLHDEISRLRQSEEPRRRRSWLTNFWPQFSLATAAAVVLATVSVVWFRTEMKTNDTGAQLAMRAPVVDAPNETNALLHSLDQAPVDRLAENDNSKLADPLHSAESASSDGNVADAGVARAAPLTQAPAAATFKAAGAIAQRRQLQTSNLRQRFSQSAAQNVAGLSENKLKQRLAVLNTFAVQQEGDSIRVLDEDGSTYIGKLEQIAKNDARSLAQKKEQNAAVSSATAVQPDEQASPNELFFRAIGFNNTLKKRVVFEGNYIAMPMQNQGGQAKDPPNEKQTPARIVGTAKIPGEPSVDVDAVSVDR